jgi:predicted  nucleic acid-binding Zn-ribbon protein
MNNGENYRIEPDSFPSFLIKSKKELNDCPEGDLKAKDTLKVLESQKQRLEIDLEACNHRFLKEKSQLESKIAAFEANEGKLKEELMFVKNEFSRFKDRSVESNEKFLFLESQVDFLNKENKRLAEQHKIDKENWELKLENLKKNVKGDSSESVKLSLALSKAEARIASLTGEVEELRSKNEFQKTSYQQKLDYVQGEVAKLKQEEEKYIKELEAKNKDNEEIIRQLNKKIQEIEKMMEKQKKIGFSKKNEVKTFEKSLSVSEKLSKSYKSPLVSSPATKAKPQQSTRRSSSTVKESDSAKSIRKKPPSRDSSAEKTMPTRVHNKAPSYLRKENQSNNIELIEKEIAVLTGRYKYLLQMSQEASELQSLRTEIHKVANEIEEKSNMLFALKKKQKEFLMQQVNY